MVGDGLGVTYEPSIAERIAWTSGRLWSAGAQVLLALASCGDWMTGQNCRPYLSTLVKRSGLSQATVTRSLRRLEREGWILARTRRHRHSTAYDLHVEQLATHSPKEQQTTLPTVSVSTPSAAQNEQQRRFAAQNEQQPTKSDAQNEQPISLPDLDLVRTHTPRAREDDATEPDLPLLGPTPPPRCQHPYAHAWCDGRIHVPRKLHFEFLDRLDTRPGESPSTKAGRLVAFYAAEDARLPATTAIGNPFQFWNLAFTAWIAREAASPVQAARPYAYTCPHDPPCANGPNWQCHQRTVLDAAKAERVRQVG